jgi:hypothetical protein
MTKVHKKQPDLSSAPRDLALGDSCLDPRVPLGFYIAVRVERGESIETYFRNKHSRGEFGAYWPLHQIARGR